MITIETNKEMGLFKRAALFIGVLFALAFGYIMQLWLFSDWEGRFHWNILAYKKNLHFGIFWVVYTLVIIIAMAWNVVRPFKKSGSGSSDRMKRGNVSENGVNKQ